MTATIETWMPEARQLAAQCWCDPETEDRVMDTALAEAVARRIAAWMDSAAMFNRNSDFYRGIVCQIGETFGVAAKTSDDGSVQEDVLALKVPKLVTELKERFESAKLTLRAKLDDMLVAEVRRFNGIPRLNKEEMELRQALADFLLPNEQ